MSIALLAGIKARVGHDKRGIRIEPLPNIYIALCAEGLLTEVESLLEVSAIAVPVASMATPSAIRFISCNQN
jgi:hypothetical protein